MTKTTAETKAPAASKPTPTMSWENDTIAVSLLPLPDAPEELNLQAIDLAVMVGLTVPDGDKVKKASARCKIYKDGADHPAQTNAAKMINAYLRSIGANAAHYDLAGAIAQIELPKPPVAEKEEKAPAVTDWHDAPEADALTAALATADGHAVAYAAGESTARASLLAFGASLAAVVGAFENKAVFDTWIADASDAVKAIAKTKNSIAEHAFISRLPVDFVDTLGAGAMSAKTIQRDFNAVKNSIAGQLATRIWKGKASMPTAAAMQKSIIADLESMNDAAGQEAIVAQAFADALFADVFEGEEKFMFIEVVDGVPAAVKLADGTYQAQTVFGTGKRANELLLAVLKEVVEQTPLSDEEKADADEKEAQNDSAKKAAPRTFSEFSITQAAIHLARILSAHDDCFDVLDMVQGYADKADKRGWSDVLGDAQEAETEAQQKAADDAAETAGDDAA